MCFHRFCEGWIQQHRVHLQYLLSVHRRQRLCKPDETSMHEHVRALVDRVMTHYESCCRAKSSAPKHNVLSIFSSAWAPSLERALFRIGGWRPTTAFHLIYSESGLRFEAQLPSLLRSGDLGDLSPDQLARVSELQCETVREEDQITDEMGELQEGLGGRVSDLRDLIQGLEEVLKRADDPRLRTIRKVVVVEILSPLQAVDFLVAAAELEIGFHEWGVERDRRRNLTRQTVTFSAPKR